MQFISIIATSLLAAASVSAAPAKRAVKAMAAADNAQWTFESFTRACNEDGSSCDVSFGINTNDGSAVTPCNYTVTGSPAYQQTVVNTACGDFLVGSTWANQGDPAKDFTTWSVHNSALIAFPAYNDALLASGQAVSPDQSFPAQQFSG